MKKFKKNPDLDESVSKLYKESVFIAKNRFNQKEFYISKHYKTFFRRNLKKLNQ